jgi:hypothetical protein
VLSTGDAWVDFLDAGGDARLKVMRPRECFSVCKYPIAYRANQAFPQRLVPFVLIEIQQIEQPAVAERAPWMAFTRTRSRSELRRAPAGDRVEGLVGRGRVVPEAGLEPARFYSHAPQACVSANSTTPARGA